MPKGVCKSISVRKSDYQLDKEILEEVTLNMLQMRIDTDKLKILLSNAGVIGGIIFVGLRSRKVVECFSWYDASENILGLRKTSKRHWCRTVKDWDVDTVLVLANDIFFKLNDLDTLIQTLRSMNVNAFFNNKRVAQKENVK